MQRVKSGIFTPATRLLQRIPNAGKFFLILLVFVVPLAYLSWNSVVEKQQQLAFYQLQQQGLKRFSDAYRMLPRLLAIRDRDYAAEFGFNSNQAELIQFGRDIDNGLAQLTGIGSPTSQQQLAEVSRLWQSRAEHGATPDLYDLDPRGDRFLVLQVPQEDAPISLFVNWVSALEER